MFQTAHLTDRRPLGTDIAPEGGCACGHCALCEDLFQPITYDLPEGRDDLLLPESFVTSGGRWTDGGGFTTVLGGPGGTITWSLVGAGVTDATGIGFFSGESVDMSTYIPFDYEATLQRAFDAWSAYGNINFVQVPDGGGNIGEATDPTIRVVSGYIDGDGRTMGQAFFPTDLPFGGDIVFDSGDEDRFQTEANFYFIALHEIGHAIGLRHTSTNPAIMRPAFNPGLGDLQADDIAGVQAIYGPAPATQAVALRDADGSLADRFGTIAQAAAAASDGFTISVGAGYTGGIETVTIELDDLSLRLPSNASATVTLSGTKSKVFTLLGAGDGLINGNEADNRLTGAAGNDTLAGFSGDDTIKGLDGNDTVYGGDGTGAGSGADYISTRDGADVVFAEDGADVVFGGKGTDSIDGGTGADSLYGGPGNDTLLGAAGDDLLVGQDDADVMQGGTGLDNMFGGAGNDTLEGNAQNDTLNGQAGDDSLLGGDGDDLIIGKYGDDFISGGSGADNIFAGAEADTVNGGLGNDTIRGEGQDDLLNGEGGNDTITGGGGRDTINGGDEADSLSGQGGLDIINGDAGNDTLSGGDGPDDLFGGAGNDLLLGGDSTDRLDGGTGDDELRGNAGIDTFVFAEGYDADAIIGFQVGTDRIELVSDVLIGTGAGTVAQVLDPGTGIASQTSSFLVTLDFGGGDVLTVGSGTALTLADLAGGMTIV